jgi:hypothetical protein
MTSKNRAIHGSVKIVTCRTCQSNVPLFELEAETDTDSVGFCSAARCNGLDLVLAETTLEGWRAAQSGDVASLLSRLSGLSGMTDLHILRIERVEQNPKPPAGAPFSEFKKLYKSPIVIYACPCCVGGEAVETQEVPISKYDCSIILSTPSRPSPACRECMPIAISA